MSIVTQKLGNEDCILMVTCMIVGIEMKFIDIL